MDTSRVGSFLTGRRRSTVESLDDRSIKALETPTRLKTDRKSPLEKDIDVSPHTVMAPSSRASVAPWETDELIPDHRRDLARLNIGPPLLNSSRSNQSLNGSVFSSSPVLKDPTPLYGRHNKPSLQSIQLFSSSYNPADDLGSLSPGFHPMNTGDYIDYRRPSVASSIHPPDSPSPPAPTPPAEPKVHKKKLQGFFGDEFATEEKNRKGSDASTSQSLQCADDDASTRSKSNTAEASSLLSRTKGEDGAVLMSRQGSIGAQRPSSPDGSVKSRTLQVQGSSEVTPWDFVELEDSPKLPEIINPTPSKLSKTTARLHLHRHKKSNDERKRSAEDQSGTSSQDRSFETATRASLSSSGTVKARSASPTPSMGSFQSRDTLPSSRSQQISQSTKRSIFSRVTGRHKETPATADRSANRLQSTSSHNLAAVARNASTSINTNAEAIKYSRNRKPTVADIRATGTPEKTATQKKDHRFKSTKRGDSKDDGPITKDPNAFKSPGTGAVAALWHLDTDIGNMEGIVNISQVRQPSLIATPAAGKFDAPAESFPWDLQQPEEIKIGAWDAPDSWAVKRIPDAPLLSDEQEETETRPRDIGPMYFMRIFRADSTFAVISASIHTTSAELIQTMAKKTFLQDELDTYQLVLRKQGLSRQLLGSEKPLQIQADLLHMAGYQEVDNLSDIGREDHGYLCRFTFSPYKMTGYSSLEKDPGFNKTQKFSHIDLAGRGLVTIPLALYQKASEIVTLNLSQNLSLDVPKEFMQSCLNLREMKYTSNESTRIPSSFAHAARLTMVDFSNNRLVNLDYSDLDRLQGLISLKLSNNTIAHLPSYLGNYQALRSLNLASNSLTEFPDFLGQLTTLVDLDISFNSIASLPCIGKLTNMEKLFATNNKLSGPFPDNFRDLVNLVILDARFNSIDSIDVVSQLPKLEQLHVSHNAITAFEGTFGRLKILMIDHNPVTRFGFTAPIPSLTILNIASAKISQLPDDLYLKMSGLTKLVLNKNHLTSVSAQIGQLTKLEHLGIAKNHLLSLPPEIGLLQQLRELDVRENNLPSLPSEIWFAKRLDTLNVASNVLADFPKPGNPPRELPGEQHGGTPNLLPIANELDELGRLEGFQMQMRRPSYAGVMGSTVTTQISPNHSNNMRKASTASAYSSHRQPSLTAKSSQDSGLNTPTTSRKDSTLSGKLAQTFASSMKTLIMADNRLTDDVFDELMLLTELRQLNLSYNELYDMPPRTLKRWPNLTELFLSGNDLTSIPAEDFDESSCLRILHLNNNKFQVLPAEIGNIPKLQTLDVASNALKYNVTNWPYDWNWNYNPQLRYLNLSGNKRLEIRPGNNANNAGRGEVRDLTDFSKLSSLRILGLMDVTLTIPSVPDEGPDRRVRTAGSIIGTSIPYGMADTLGRSDHLSTLDMVIPNFRGSEDQTVFGMFDGQLLNSGGSRVARYLHEKFRYVFADELDKLRTKFGETALDALRRTYLALNKELASAAIDKQEHAAANSSTGLTMRRPSLGGPELGEDDVTSGAVATVCYLHGMDLYVSNVGDAQAVLISSDRSPQVITAKHDPSHAEERQRIKAAGGFVSRQGKLNDALEVSRAFGYAQLMPVVSAAPHVSKITLKDSDEMILLASRDLWQYLTTEFAADTARKERNDLMRAAQRLRDLAIAFGASSKIMVMLVGVSDLKKREKARFRAHNMSMGPSGLSDDYFATTRRPKRGRDNVNDSKLNRLDHEVEAPIGEVSLVFTDIKNSTMLWETYPIAMRSAIKMHNDVMRRHLRIIGGYEVKTEGDAFMVAFPTVTSALLWCFTIQSQLLDVQWPQEILNSPSGQEVVCSDGNVIFRGLSVRMGIHWGRPVCEPDPITKRMDYFGPMVNRAARIESVADGGQIAVSSDFISEIQRLLETHMDSDRAGSIGGEEDEPLNQAIKRELRSLSSGGFEVKDLGLKHLKGLENPEYIYLMYPHSLAARLTVQQQRDEAALAAAASLKNAGITTASALISTNVRNKSTELANLDDLRAPNSELFIESDVFWRLWNVSMRLSLLCSTLENKDVTQVQQAEPTTLRSLGINHGEVNDSMLLDLIGLHVTRIETCTTTLQLRNAIRPFRDGGLLAGAGPMHEIMNQVLDDLNELKLIKASTASAIESPTPSSSYVTSVEIENE